MNKQEKVKYYEKVIRDETMTYAEEQALKGAEKRAYEKARRKVSREDFSFKFRFQLWFHDWCLFWERLGIIKDGRTGEQRFLDDWIYEKNRIVNFIAGVHNFFSFKSNWRKKRFYSKLVKEEENAFLKLMGELRGEERKYPEDKEVMNFILKSWGETLPLPGVNQFEEKKFAWLKSLSKEDRRLYMCELQKIELKRDLFSLVEQFKIKDRNEDFYKISKENFKWKLSLAVKWWLGLGW